MLERSVCIFGFYLCRSTNTQSSFISLNSYWNRCRLEKTDENYPFLLLLFGLRLLL
jgi:hypothetical protein